jgi:MFS transporter, DHA2 family, multidrug resistance protein
MLGAHGECASRGGSIGAALMAVILGNEFDRSESITAANKFAIPRRGADERGIPVESPR